MSPVWSALGLSLLPNLGGFAGAYFTRKNLGWYKPLNKPKWTPPDWAFGPIWTALYTGMGYASYLVLRDGSPEAIKLPLALYGSKLLLNWAWTPIFFGFHNIKLAFLDIVLLWGNAAACGLTFYSINKTAGLIFIPYMAWLSIATTLNYYILANNPTPETTKAK